LTARIFTFILLVTFSLGAAAQKTDTAFQKEWKEINNDITKDDLTKTALAKVNALYKKAKLHQEQDQVLKALLYRYSLEERVIENNPLRIINSIKEEITHTTDPVQKAMLYTILAKQYKSYFTRNRWGLYGRAQTKNNNKTDITTWSAGDFADSIRHAFSKALQYKETLKQKKVSLYDAVILKGNARELRPTLFDLVAHEALDYYTSSDFYPTTPKEDFIISDPNTLQPAAVFVAARFKTNDSSSSRWMALDLFKQLIVFHRNDADKNALVTVDLERLEWAYEQAVVPTKDVLYKNTLQKITEQYAAVNEAAYAWYLLANIEFAKAGSYDPFSDTANRYGYVKAMEIIKKGLSYFKESNRGVGELKNLLAQIKRVEIKTETELVTIPGKPILASAIYRNTDTLFGRIYKLKPRDSQFVENGISDWKEITAIKPLRTFIQPLPATGDHQQHTAEFRIDNLPPGYYALMSSNHAGFVDTLDKMSLQYFHVSAISYVRSKDDLFVLNRETGAPMADVKTLLIKESYSSLLRKNIYDTIATKKTDRNGNIKLPYWQDGGIEYTFIIPGDSLHLPSNDYLYNAATKEDSKEGFEKKNRKVFFFTDRSIYRPGQVVFFKGIAVTKDFDTKLSKTITKDPVMVYLLDVNGKPIDSIKTTLNNYGSITGKFNLPQNALTGTFRVEARNFNYSVSYFSVEEYKRPTFSVTIEKPKGSYRLNDNITVNGTAKSFSGNVIDGATVSYNITRNKRFLDPWFWRRPSNRGNNVEVAHGVVKTNAQGKFTIQFPAYADDITDSAGNPLFEFNIKADVTDINGETRSASATVSTGFKSLLLEVSANNLANKDSALKIAINTTNFSNEKEPAEVKVMVYTLQVSPFKRSRKLSRPDQFIMTKNEFEKYFPADQYDNEMDAEKAPTGEMLFEETIHTKDKSEVIIQPNRLPAGYYKISAVTKDKSGNEVKQTAYTMLFDRKNMATFLDLNELTYTVNNTVEPGQEASFISAIRPDRVFMISKTERPVTAKNKNEFEFKYVNKGIHTVNYTADEKDRGDVNITEMFVYDNRVYTKSYNVKVPWTNKMLNVSYESYRDKSEPGNKEKWTVAITGNTGEKAAAELLTGMYDASLDQFKPHSWAKPEVWPNNYVTTAFDHYSNFRMSGMEYENNPPWQTIDISYVVHDRLAFNAEEIWTLENINVRGVVFAQSALPRMAMDMGGAMLNETVVVGYGTQKKSLTAPVVSIRGNSSINNGNQPLYVVNGKVVTDISGISPDNIVSTEVMNGAQATALYGAQAANGAIILTTKNGPQAPPIVVRKNFNETAFFFPQLYADSTGKYSFSFTMPESLTQWKWMSLAHTKDLSFGTTCNQHRYTEKINGTGQCTKVYARRR
jgi:TonB-dependent SusC/RagA subfamily outer membrane receptor